MKRLSLALAVLLTGTVLGQGAMNQGPCKMDGSDCSAGGATPTPVPTFVGDSGTGGTAGLVPAPAAGDAVKGLTLLASGGWGARPRVLFSQTATVTITNSTAETTLVGAGSGSTTLAGGTAYVGQTFRITQGGTVDDKGNYVFVTSKYKLGSVVIATTVATTQTFGVTPYVSGIVCTVRAVGASGSLSCVGAWKGNLVPIALATPTVSTVDFTADQTWGRTDTLNVGTGGVYSSSTFFTVETY